MNDDLAAALAGATIVDLSMPLVEHWRYKFSISYRTAEESGQPFHSTDLALSAHAFTHVDAPWHVLADGARLGAVDLDRLRGQAAVIDVSDLGSDAAVDDRILAARGAHVRHGDIVLIRSDQELRHPTTSPAFWTRSPHLTESGVRWLLERAPRAVGYDFPQDRAIRAPYLEDFAPHPDGRLGDWPCHHLLLENGIPQIEYLRNLGPLPERVAFLALPLNIPDSDGSPTRAVALIG